MLMNDCKGIIEDQDDSSANNNSQLNGDPNSNWQNQQSTNQNPESKFVKKELDDFDMGISGSSSEVNGQNINLAMKFDEDEKNDPLGIEDILCLFNRKFGENCYF